MNETDNNIKWNKKRCNYIISIIKFITAGKGEFEDGYSRGYRDASRVGTASAARRKMDEDYGAREGRFHEGYAKGLRDAGMSGMTTSMHNLAQRPANNLGYSSGYMQGFRDGNSGVFGDRITNQLLKRLEEQYPNQEELKQGYIDGFKEGTRQSGGNRFEDSRRLQQSLTELTERLTSLEKTKGDEIHSTKIYHVYNQQPEVVGYSATGEQLARELEELNSRSRTSTLRRHYTVCLGPIYWFRRGFRKLSYVPQFLGYYFADTPSPWNLIMVLQV